MNVITHIQKIIFINTNPSWAPKLSFPIVIHLPDQMLPHGFHQWWTLTHCNDTSLWHTLYPPATHTPHGLSVLNDRISWPQTLVTQIFPEPQTYRFLSCPLKKISYNSSLRSGNARSFSYLGFLSIESSIVWDCQKKYPFHTLGINLDTIFSFVKKFTYESPR